MPKIPQSQDSQTTFKPNLTCIFLSTRARYIVSNLDERPCTIKSFHSLESFKINGYIYIGFQIGLWEMTELHTECGDSCWIHVF